MSATTLAIAERWTLLAARQLCACLALEGRRRQLELTLERLVAATGDHALRYYLGLACAIENDVEAAVGHLNKVLEQAPEHEACRILLYKLHLRRAAYYLQTRNPRGLAEAIEAVLKAAPPGIQASSELAPFQSALPFAYIQAGNREEAARIWEQQLREKPGETAVLHNLAVLYYWWAQQEMERDGSAAARLWVDAVCYWTALLNQDSYWEAFRNEREKLWKITFKPDDLQAFRATFLQEQLCRLVEERANACRAQGDQTGAQRYEELLTLALLEKHSAKWWRAFLESAGRRTRQGQPDLTSVPAGYHFFSRFGLLAVVEQNIAWLSEKQPQAACLPWLRIYFSKDGLGRIAVLLEDQNRPAEALRVWQSLPASAKASPEACYLASRALARHAEDLFRKDQITEALKAWGEAFGIIQSQTAKLAAESELNRMFQASREQACTRLAELVLDKARQLKGEGNREAAVRLLEQVLDACDSEQVRNFLCTLYCERGAEHLAKERYAQARKEFEKALKRCPKHPNALAGMSSAYNKEGVDCANRGEWSRAIELFEKALEYNPGNDVARSNLAQARLARLVLRGY